MNTVGEPEWDGYRVTEAEVERRRQHLERMRNGIAPVKPTRYSMFFREKGQSYAIKRTSDRLDSLQERTEQYRESGRYEYVRIVDNSTGENLYVYEGEG